ncbi:sigma 54-interacting transcriptional regulator [Tepidanaerobacter sp. GT38]|nr:sigma 54-interacting transcriptional regulator [Tepidanaerobacter sp. GT38]MCG1011693.1 sigma 54-interacting transcriptional regulator [Tepidanaerobacter sp. GT38]
MASLLKNMQDTVAKYANVLSQILKVDVEIVDENLDRIAGTGMFAGRINKNIEHEGYVYKEVIKTGKRKIIKEPGRHKICTNCPKLLKQGYCEETFEMSMPISTGEKVIGVIGFVCFNNEQKEHILHNFDTFAEFLEQISDLISTKAKEEIEKENMLMIIDMLNHIIDKMDQGVIIADEEGKVSSLNSIAKKILEVDSDKNLHIKLRATGNTVINMKEYELIMPKKTYIIAGEEYRILQSNFKYSKVFIFTDINSLKHKIFSATTTKEDMGLKNIIGESSSMKILKSKVKKIAQSSSTVLITGESGTGKELFARAIHMESKRSNNPFVAINCAAVPDTLLESELFGYVKGAFTGADPKGKIGKVEFANTGTLFLDEIGDMPLYLQAKLLRVLEQKEVVRLGSNKPIPVDVRVIAATNKNLEKLIEEGSFREDLYYRLNVLPINIPPLRERKEDIRVLTDYFVRKYTALFKKRVVGFENEVWDFLYKYDWQGNVRELENTVEYMINMLDQNGIISVSLLPQKIRFDLNKHNDLIPLEKMEIDLIKRALDLYGGSVTGKQKAAEALGIGIATLYRKIKKYSLE